MDLAIVIKTLEEANDKLKYFFWRLYRKFLRLRGWKTRR